MKTNPTFTRSIMALLGCVATFWLAQAACATVDPTDVFYDSTAGNTTTTGGSNSAFGHLALASIADGFYATAVGTQALFNNTTGNNNTACGTYSLFFNTTGHENTALGFEAVLDNNTGFANTGIGTFALRSNVMGNYNTALGENALFDNTASNNTATGYNALYNNTTGADNTAGGFEAMYANTTGKNNTASGWDALKNNTTGNGNVALGFDALQNNKTGGNNIAIGTSAGLNLTTGSNNIDLGALGAAGESNTIRIGKASAQTAAFIVGIRGSTVAGGVSVMVDASNRLGTVTSSARYKDNIRPMAQASEALLSLQPVTFRYKKELDSLGIPQFGLVAEQVDKVDPDLVARDEQGKPYSVRYEAVNAMLLNEFLKEHRRVEEQACINREQTDTITELKTTLAQQQSQIKALTDGLQKVSARMETTASPRVVTNEP